MPSYLEDGRTPFAGPRVLFARSEYSGFQTVIDRGTGICGIFYGSSEQKRKIFVIFKGNKAGVLPFFGQKYIEREGLN